MKCKWILPVLFAIIGLTACGKKDEVSKKIDIEEQNNQMPKIIVTTDEKPDEELTEEVIDKGELYSQIQKRAAEEGNTKISGPLKETCFLMPILQNPSDTSVYVQWFTEDEGVDNKVLIYESTESIEPIREVSAGTQKMSRLRGGKKESNCNNPSIKSDIYKHVACVDSLPEYEGYESQRVYYRISSSGETSDMYSLSAKPKPGTPLRVLLTSDLQIKKMCAANFQKVYEQLGHIDAVFVDGDIVDVSDRVYDWFYADNAFWKVMTGTACHNIEGKDYYGAPIAQQAPIYTAIGNHDVMGVYDEITDLSVQFNNPLPREYAEELYNLSSAQIENKEEFIRDHSYNTITYEEMFELPSNNDAHNEKYYSTTFGDIALIALDVSRVWRLPNVGIMGKYSELPGTNIANYGFGDFIFEPITRDSEQIRFLEKELKSDSYVNSKYKVTMFHQESHSLGGNILPVFTDPVQNTATDSLSGVPMITYNYPIENDYIHSIIEPMLEDNGNQLLFNAHSHLWNRFVTKKGMNVLETSNVGNSYGAYVGEDKRTSIPSSLEPSDQRSGMASAYETSNYPKSGDPFLLEPIMPNVCDVPGKTPFVASNDITVFSIFDTDSGKVDSFYYDTKAEDDGVVLFDSFDVLMVQ